MEIHQDVYNVIIGLSVLVGALQCFFGYRIFKLILGLTGFLISGILAGAIGYSFSPEEPFVILSALVGGFIGATLMVMLYYVGIFLIGALLGGFLGTVLYAMAENIPEPAVLLILAIITGVIALVAQKFMIIVSTGFGGAWLVVTGIAFFTTGIVDLSNVDQIFSSIGSHLYAIILCWLALGIVGVIGQYQSESKKVPQSSTEPHIKEPSGFNKY